MPRKKQKKSRPIKLSTWIGPSRWQTELQLILEACDSSKASPAAPEEERVLPWLACEGLIILVGAVEAKSHYETTQRGRHILAMLRAA